MPLKARVKDRDLGMKSLFKARELFRRGDALIGVFGDLGSDLVLRASVHEFGAPSVGIPERSFLRATLDDKRTEIVRRAERAMDRVIADITRDKPADAAATRELNLLALFVVKAVRERIRSNIPPPLAESTIAAKGSSIALIDTGRMIQAITHRVTVNGRAP